MEVVFYYEKGALFADLGLGLEVVVHAVSLGYTMLYNWHIWGTMQMRWNGCDKLLWGTIKLNINHNGCQRLVRNISVFFTCFAEYMCSVTVLQKLAVESLSFLKMVRVSLSYSS
jgi:hypothetical protein